MEIKKIRVAVAGLGNLGKACIEQIKQRNEFELVAVFSRRAVPGTVLLDDIDKYKGKIDVVIACVGSSDDAPVLVPRLAKSFSTVDSFDTHAKVPEYIKSVAAATKTGNSTCIVSTGWDPGLMSVIRLYLSAFMPAAATESFWGPGVSMGHTNAIKNITGVQDAIQFTIPKPDALEAAIKGQPIPSNQKHKRVCYVVADKKDQAEIENKIKTMPNYFAGYETEVHFINQAKFDKEYKNRNEHAGQVFSVDTRSKAHFEFTLESNAHFTAQIMLAYAIANYNLQKDNKKGVFTVADVAPKYLFNRNILDLI